MIEYTPSGRSKGDAGEAETGGRFHHAIESLREAALELEHEGRIGENGDDIVVDAIHRAVPGLQAVYRFGSSVTGGAHRGSDVDIAFLAQAPLASTRRFDLEQTLASALKRDVDLVDLRAASTVMALQIVSTGILLGDLDPAARGAFEDLTYSAYARLNEERRHILKRASTEGSIYGR